MKQFYLLTILLCTTLTAKAEVTIQTVAGWFEAGYITWTASADATGYNVYVSPSSSDSFTKLDKELVREYPGYVRADALGLKAGDYKFKIVPVVNGTEKSEDATISSSFKVTAHDRSGFAHVGMNDGIGAYKNDGTLKDGAKVIYVWADNAKTVSTNVKTGSKETNITEGKGLQNIVYLYQKGYDSTPLDIRIIGTIKGDNMDSFGSSAEGLQVKGNNEYQNMPITIEGVGDDAAIHGFGILCRNCHNTEFRNFAIMYCLDDCLSLDTGNSNVWVHNMDLFYGKPGSDSDQKKGDGTIDVKGVSKNITISYNHFFDTGKSSLGGMKSETTSCWLTYHHNWFDHSDSRHPRIRTMFFHIYNNYFDGNAKYGVGMTMGGSALVENNYFRNCKYPMLISLQGTDAEGDGTFSGESGGIIKAYNNTIVNERQILYYDGSQTDGKWDAVLAKTRDEAVTATAYNGGTSYNSEADNAARTTYIESKIEEPSTVVASIKGNLGAGRMNHGDFTWKFLNSAQDENYEVITDLTNAVQGYKSMLVGFYGGEKISNGGATTAFVGGDGQNISEEANNSYVPSWVKGGGSGGTGDDAPVAVIGSDSDYFWIITANETQVNAYINDGTIAFDSGSKFQTTANVESNGTVYSDKIGSLQLAKSSGYATFYNASGIAKIGLYIVRTGSMAGAIYGSSNGTDYTKIQEYSGSKGTKELTVPISDPDIKYVKITNTATGSLHIQGLKIYQPTATALEIPVEDVENNDANIYDLQGRRQNTLKSGLNIYKGKIILVK